MTNKYRLGIRGVPLWTAIAMMAAGGLATAPIPCSAAETGNALRVGITPEYPPLVFRTAEATNGVEIDFAKALGEELGRPVEFVVLRWDQQIQALLDRETDIIMSGMSVTKARQLRVSFCNPYVHNQLRVIFPVKSAPRFKSADDVRKSDARIGVVAGTTGATFVKQNCPLAQIVSVTMRRDVGVYLLRANKMDAFIDDSFALADILSQNEGDISYLKEPLSEEDLAWAVRPGDKELREKINGILERWKLNGTSEKILDHWIPYLKKMGQQPSAKEAKAGQN